MPTPQRCVLPMRATDARYRWVLTYQLLLSCILHGPFNSHSRELRRARVYCFVG